MDPLSLQSSNLGVVRPAIALKADLGAVLREGRVLAGEVLQSFGGGALLIGIGRHRVPAQSDVALEEGHRFLFVVEGEGENLVLRVLGDDAAVESSLLRALRRVLGQDQPLGRLLGAALRAVADGVTAPALTAELAAHVSRPELGVSHLSAQLRSGAGLAYEARLAGAAALRLPAGEAARLAGELEAWLAERLTARGGLPPPSTGHSQASELIEGLRAQVAELLGAGPSNASREAVFAAWLAAASTASLPDRPAPTLAQLLEAAIGRLYEGALRSELVARLQAASLPTLGPGLEVLLLRRLLGLGAPQADLAEEQVRVAVQQARADMKGGLLRALAVLAEGPQHETLARALGGLEAEQLLNVARRDAGEAVHWSLPLADGSSWTTAHVFVEPHRPGDWAGQEDGAEGPWRLSLAVDLSRTGPLWADLLARPGSLFVRVRASRPDVVAALSEGLEQLEARLAHAGRSVQIVLGEAPAAELSVDEAAVDVRFLRDHHLMDLSA